MFTHTTQEDENQLKKDVRNNKKYLDFKDCHDRMYKYRTEYLTNRNIWQVWRDHYIYGIKFNDK